MLSQLLTTNGNTAATNFFGGPGTLFATGLFAGGSVKLQASLDGVTDWFDCKDPSATVLTIAAGGILNFDIAPCSLRGVLSGATVAGNAMVRTATAVGTVTVGGIATLTIISTLINGGVPRVIPFEVSAGDTPAVWAVKARTALQDDIQYGRFFTVSGASTSIVTTSIGPVFLTNDGTHNLAIATGTATGITAAPTSVLSTTGVASTTAVTIRIAERITN